ncbi:putative oxoglutarate/iron-dependent dioxygenase, non-heme dioxygenase domain-containing protein [Helianthus annuus]|uniref:Oxoglutarate/iron-dependent dioxygenase, non-heme dioxygenase domain-containing protein n=1 Tax=Helianthus annuus TaxID=4232 RepID=A0A251VEU8_HELAN|nr:flavanone 3-dioxygenase 2 [Helianthus annuus]KAF5816939.1 putative oxoglutarate/iron-dependent dioxygenase, non-heme dioxygenase domain-containing protein [Helianthus annuus]KAJ0603478.1 putative oxoglutarate/iron-dependent dioxygenase, non-heme dioxygenase domain-containing protein [Helianthus annuus]KAJ0613563.1 putative oxoglutarate/iron-dependent dioxygenase, non-heme dioxygenase domain-containing protein [Helianthus annuus]KAJ0617391.1 putative oxoglutarate/iron-dependent dioxygenase, n
MANSPHSSYNIPLDFRAPPPSPVASGRRSSVANDEILTEFLHRSLRVPDLVLPNRVFPRQNSKIQNLPKLDFEKLNPNPNPNHAINFEVIDVIAQTGCFELVNHGISGELLASVVKSGGGVFELSPEKKKVVSRSNERSYGFVEFHGDEKESSEEFVWCRDDSLRSEMEEIWPNQYSNFSEIMETLMCEIENISEILLKWFMNGSTSKRRFDEDGTRERENGGSVCYIYKHCPDGGIVPDDDKCMDSLRYDVIRMLIRGSEHPHTLCFHVCDGSSEFHVYSKKGWVSFSPDNDALIITIGDQLQTWSEGKYKHVIGRPIFKGKQEDCVSLAFLYNPPPPTPTSKGQKDKTISLGHQILLVLILVFLYNLYSYIFT